MRRTLLLALALCPQRQCFARTTRPLNQPPVCPPLAPFTSAALPLTKVPIWEPSDARRAPPGFKFGLDLDGTQHYTVLTGHGSCDPALDGIVIPQGTQLWVFNTPGSGLTHGFANILEQGDAYEVCYRMWQCCGAGAGLRSQRREATG